METRLKLKTLDAKNEKVLEKIRKKSLKNPNVYFDYLKSAAQKGDNLLLQKILEDNPISIGAEEIRSLMVILIRKKNFDGFQLCGSYLKSIEKLDFVPIDHLEIKHGALDGIQAVFQEEFKEVRKTTSLPRIAVKRDLKFFKYLLDEHFFNHGALNEIYKNISTEKISVDMADYILSYAKKNDLLIEGQPLIDYVFYNLLDSIFSKKSAPDAMTLEKFFLLYDTYQAKMPEEINASHLTELNKFLEKCKHNKSLNPTKIDPGKIAYFQAKVVRARANSRDNDMKKNEEEAQVYIKEAIANNYPAAFEDVADTYLKEKKYTEAFKNFEQARKNLPAHDKAAYLIEHLLPSLVEDFKNKEAQSFVRTREFSNYLAIFAASKVPPMADVRLPASTLLMIAHWLPPNEENTKKALELAYSAYCKAINLHDNKTATQAKDDIYAHFLPEIMKHSKQVKIDFEIEFILEGDNTKLINSKIIQHIVQRSIENKEHALALCDIAVMLPELVQLAIDETPRDPATTDFLALLYENRSHYLGFPFYNQLSSVLESKPPVISLAAPQGPALFSPKLASPISSDKNHRQTLEALLTLTEEEKKVLDEDTMIQLRRFILGALKEDPKGNIDIDQFHQALVKIQVEEFILKKTPPENTLIKNRLDKVAEWFQNVSKGPIPKK